MKVWKKGEIVVLTFDGHTVAARVDLASANGYALMLTLGKPLSRYADSIALLYVEEADEFRDLILGLPAKLAPAEFAP